MNLGTLALESTGGELSSSQGTGKFGQSERLRFMERSLMMRNRMLERLQKAELQVTMGCRRIGHRLEVMGEETY